MIITTLVYFRVRKGTNSAHDLPKTY